MTVLRWCFLGLVGYFRESAKCGLSSKDIGEGVLVHFRVRFIWPASNVLLLMFLMFIHENV